MAGYIAGITIEFGADTKQLNAALGKFQSKLNKTQAELRQVNAALKFNPRNTTLLQQKFKLLQTQVTQTSAKLKGLQSLQRRMDSAGIDKNSAAYQKLEREIIKTENQLKRAEGELRKFGSVGKQQCIAVGNAFKTAGGKIKSAGRTITTSISAYGAIGIYAGAKLIEMSQKQAEAELKLTNVYKKSMGASKDAAEATMEYASALQETGVIGDEVTLAGAAVLAQYAETPGAINAILPAMDNYLAKTKGLDATQEDAEAAAKLFGKALNGNTTALERQGYKLSDAQKEILKTGTEEEKAAMLADLMAKKTGNMNEELAKTDAGKIQQAKNALGDMGEEIGAVLLPAVADLVSWFQANLMPKLQQFIDFMKQHPQIATFALALAGITAVLGPLIMIFGSLVSVIGGLITIAPVLAGVIGAISAPVLAVVAAIAAAIAIGIALYKNWNTIKAKAQAIWNNIKTKITGAVDAIKTRVKTNFETLKNTVTNIFTAIKSTATTTWNNIKNAIINPINTAKDKVKNAVQTIKEKLNSVKNIGKNAFNILTGLRWPKIKIYGGKIPFGIGGKGVKPHIDVTWNKKAMMNPYMFSGATLFGAGEAGDEVLYGRQALMRDIAQAVGGGGSIVMNVYGSDNMSVNELANAVEQRLIRAQNRRRQAWQ